MIDLIIYLYITFDLQCIKQNKKDKCKFWEIKKGLSFKSLYPLVPGLLRNYNIFFLLGNFFCFKKYKYKLQFKRSYYAN